MNKFVIVAGVLFTLLGCLALEQNGFGQMKKPSSVEDACGASQFQYLIGKDAQLLKTVTGFPENTRIIFPNTAVTKDYRLDRLNIYIDPQNKVFRVNCG